MTATLTDEEKWVESLVHAYERCRAAAIVAKGVDFGPARKAAEEAEERLCAALLTYKRSFATRDHVYAVDGETDELHRVPRPVGTRQKRRG